MAYYIIITLLTISGITGWVLFFYVVKQIMISRKVEMSLVQEISNDILILQEDISTLKKTVDSAGGLNIK